MAATKKRATKKTTRKRTPKREKELKEVYGDLPAIAAEASDTTRIADLHYARLLHGGDEQTEAYVKAYKPQNAKVSSLYSMASRKARSVAVMRELDRLRRVEEEQAQKLDSLEEVLLDGERLKMDMMKVVYLLAMSPDTQDAVRLKAALELGALKHVDAFVRTGSTFNIDNSKTQNNMIVTEGKTAAELRAGIMEYLGKAAPALPAPPEPIEAEVIDVNDQD